MWGVCVSVCVCVCVSVCVRRYVDLCAHARPLRVCVCVCVLSVGKYVGVCMGVKVTLFECRV